MPSGGGCSVSHVCIMYLVYFDLRDTYYSCYVTLDDPRVKCYILITNVLDVR